MQLYILILVSLNFLSVGNDIAQSNPIEDSPIQIEVLNPEKIDFYFNMKYEQRRKIIKIRSDKPIKSLRTVDAATNTHKGYNVRGSDMVILPQSDFKNGSYIAEFKFENSADVVLAKIYVSEDAIVGAGR